jgi:hypothetical protein
MEVHGNSSSVNEDEVEITYMHLGLDHNSGQPSHAATGIR